MHAGGLSCGCWGSWQELVEYRARYYLGPGQAPPPILALGLSSRKNLCIHPNVAGARRPHSDMARTLGVRRSAGQQLTEELAIQNASVCAVRGPLACLCHGVCGGGTNLSALRFSSSVQS